MSSYQVAQIALVAGIFGHALASGTAIESALRQGISSARRAFWLAIGLGGLLLALQNGFALELALKTGLFDLRQSLLAGTAGVLYGVAVTGLSRHG